MGPLSIAALLWLCILLEDAVQRQAQLVGQLPLLRVGRHIPRILVHLAAEGVVGGGVVQPAVWSRAGRWLSGKGGGAGVAVCRAGGA